MDKCKQVVDNQMPINFVKIQLKVLSQTCNQHSDDKNALKIIFIFNKIEILYT